MPEGRVTLTVRDRPLGADDLALIDRVDVEESLGAQDKVSVVIGLLPGTLSTWTSTLESLIEPAAPFRVEIERGGRTLTVEARAVSASWDFVPGGRSTLTIGGLDRSVEMDRYQERKPWPDASDADIARRLFSARGFATDIEDTPPAVSSDLFTPQQNATDWAFLTELASRNGYDVHVETRAGVITGVFRRVAVEADPSTDTALELGHGTHGGAATATVELLAGQEVTVTRTVPGSTGTDTATDPGTGHAMGADSLGGATRVLTGTSAGTSPLDAATTARAMAERSAFAARLSVTLTGPAAPLLRARRVAAVTGLGTLLDGPWLVRSVRHTVVPGGHSQAVELLRNALGPSAGAGPLGALAGAGVAL